MGRKGVYTREHLLSDSEVGAIKEALSNPTEEAVVVTLLYTGLRVGELIHMRKNWVDWSHDSIHVPGRQPCTCTDCRNRKLNEKKKHYPGYWSPKTPRGVRTIPMLPNKFPDLSRVLRDFFKNHDTFMEVERNRGCVWEMLQDIIQRAKLDRKIFPHVFRGTYARLLARNGLDTFTITQVMGWASLDVAESYIRYEGEAIKREMSAKVTDYGTDPVAERSLLDKLFGRRK
jgi:integrase